MACKRSGVRDRLAPLWFSAIAESFFLQQSALKAAPREQTVHFIPPCFSFRGDACRVSWCRKGSHGEHR